jgi:hypothetical protein
VGITVRIESFDGSHGCKKSTTIKRHRENKEKEKQLNYFLCKSTKKKRMQLTFKRNKQVLLLGHGRFDLKKTAQTIQNQNLKRARWCS